MQQSRQKTVHVLLIGGVALRGQPVDAVGNALQALQMILFRPVRQRGVILVSLDRFDRLRVAVALFAQRLEPGETGAAFEQRQLLREAFTALLQHQFQRRKTVAPITQRFANIEQFLVAFDFALKAGRGEKQVQLRGDVGTRRQSLQAAAVVQDRVLAQRRDQAVAADRFDGAVEHRELCVELSRRELVMAQRELVLARAGVVGRDRENGLLCRRVHRVTL